MKIPLLARHRVHLAEVARLRAEIARLIDELAIIRDENKRLRHTVTAIRAAAARREGGVMDDLRERLEELVELAQLCVPDDGGHVDGSAEFTLQSKLDETVAEIAALRAEVERLREVTCAAGPLFDHLRADFDFLRFCPTSIPDDKKVVVSTTAGTIRAIVDALRGA